MAKNVVRTLNGQGRSALLTNAAETKTSGQLFLCPGTAKLVALHKMDQASGALLCPCFIGDVEVTYAHLASEAVAVGDLLYYDATNNWVTTTAGALGKAGIATSAATATAGSVTFLLGEVR